MATHTQNLSEALTLADAVVPRLYLGLLLAELVSLADAPTPAANYRRALAEVCSLEDLELVRSVAWHRVVEEFCSTPDQAEVVRDAWSVLKFQLVPEMYRLENWSKVFEFLELFGHEYNRVLGYADALPRLTGVRTAPAHLVPNLLRLLGRTLDPEKTLAEQVHELENTVAVYKRVGRTGILERAITLIEPDAVPVVDFPDDEVFRWSDAPPSGWSDGAVWGDKLEFNHHVARLGIAISIEDIEQRVADFLPAGVRLIVNIASSFIEEVPFTGTAVVGEEQDGGLYAVPEVFVLPALYMGDEDWHMGDDDIYLSDESNVNKQPFEVLEAGALHSYLGDSVSQGDSLSVTVQE